ncbi:hypothetical protein EW145_g2020 [Phellinidium pouzarii]|uniref:Uncharacterized protein n=1 Tax=Phellinidium pouzarii TaxID=167371 RepID=A0A4S4LE21_9AGAM|nr:hypothetical protein EW145_g2020 [Phellinidium pouzarii]
MATQHRQPPSRLFIPPMLNPQLMNGVDARTMYSPALQTASQPGFPSVSSAHPFNPMFSLQTPMQTTYFGPPPGAPPRPMHSGHRPSSSIAHGLGIHPSVPLTPLGQQFQPHMMHGGPPGVPSTQPFVPKSRRTPSMIGGPPKALLGGPNRKVSPLPPAAIAIQEKLKSKKVTVKVPDEQAEDASKKSLWSRKPVATSQLKIFPEFSPAETTSIELYPDEGYRRHLPLTVDVFLPGQGAWDLMKEQEIDEKLERLGIERRTELAVPEIYAPHNRSASISSPADPALLMYKLNKLQQQQSAANSLSTSPHPIPSSASPNSQFSARVQTHGYIFEHDSASGNMEPDAEGDNTAKVSSPVGIFAPQGRIPAQLSVPSVPSRAESRPDFNRGFGLDIPEEEEEEEKFQQAEPPAEAPITEPPEEQQETVSLSEDVQPIIMQDTVVGASKAGIHTRHASRVSVTLSVASVSKHLDETMVSHSRKASIEMQLGAEGEREIEVVDPLNEWTGSEDVRSAEELSEDQESIGEWSNPSDEERARHERLHRRYLRRIHREAIREQEIPRRIPEFPRPPEDQYVYRDGDSDIISNPSEEGRPVANYSNLNLDNQHYPKQAVDANSRVSRPLPPLPHSRDPSNPYSYYGSLPSHSRGPSDHFVNGQLNVPDSRPDSARHGKTPSISSSTKKDLNPFAKPFVFGARPAFTSAVAPPSVPVSVQSETASSPAQISAPSHSRLPSIGTTHVLNAGAQEFKPGGFTFRPPEGVPKLAFPEPIIPITEASRPLPETPMAGMSRAVQGREKRQRTSLSPLGSDSYESEDEEGHDSMSSFRFPRAPESTMVFTRSAPTSPSPATNRSAAALNASAKPFTFSGFSNLPPILPPLLGQEQRSLVDTLTATDLLSINATRGSVLNDDQRSPELTLPSTHRQKRAPIPLDFKHPISTNMVPAGLFKNLANGDAEERVRSARAQGSSLEFSDARSDVSLDDLSVPAISRKATKRVAKPEDLDVSQDGYDVSSKGTSHSRRSSMATSDSPDFRESIVPPNTTLYSDGLRLTETIESILDQKIDSLRQDLISHAPVEGDFVSNSTSELVKEAMAMFRTQLCESATKGLEDSSMDARGELDFEMIKSIIEQGHENTRKHIQEDLATILRNIKDSEGSATPGSILDLVRGLQELKANILASNAHLSDRLSAVEATSPYAIHQEREQFIFDLLSALGPQLAVLRSDPIDYEDLTMQLTQAVKPHISQLIDLASDKRETAELIANRLMPILQSIASTPTVFDTGNLITEMTATINRAIAPVDTHMIKEQVADLVVERLDSRLAVRDNDIAVNFDGMKSKLTDAISPLLVHFDGLSEVIDTLSRGQTDLSMKSFDFISKQSDAVKDISRVAEKLGGVAETVDLVQSLLLQQQEIEKSRNQHLERIETSVESISSTHTDFVGEKEEIMSISKQLLNELTPIPDSVSCALSAYGTKQAEFMSRMQSAQDMSQELRRLTTTNVDLQAQLVKARGLHGQVRVEKDNLNAKVITAESERDRLREKFEEMQAAALVQAAEFAALETRNAEQERAMHTALDRLKISDVNAQTQQERIAELEKTNRELTLEKHQLKLKVDGLEMQAEFVARDKDSTLQALKLLQADRDRLAAQQSYWEEFRRTADQIDTLTNLIGKVESEEVAELKRSRDRSKVLEGEHAALQKRCKEQEAKIASIERSSSTARQSLAQAQQRSVEWEKKAREFEGEVERLTTAFDQSEQTRAQLDADHSLAKLQMEERDAEERLSKDRERKLEEEVASLKTKISDLSSELEEERKVSRATSGQWAASQARPSSRASTAYEMPEPPTPRINGKALARQPISAAPSPPPVTSTWDSIHAPKHVTPLPTPSTPRVRHAIDYNARAPSPALSAISAISAVPTQGDDGWWS